MNGFNTGDKVRLTGSRWPDHLRGTIQTVSKRLNGDDCFTADDGLERHIRSGYEAELVENLFKVGDKVRWDRNGDFGDGEVLGITRKEVEVRFSEYGGYLDEEALNNKFGFDYHAVPPEYLKLVRTLAEKRQDDFKILEEASRPWRNAPDYYKFPHDVQTTDISMHLNSNGGQAVGYISRSTRIDGQNKEDDPRESLRKAIDLIEMEIYRLDEKFGDTE